MSRCRCRMTRFWVNVPVLSVHRTSIAPKFWMALRRFTIVFRRAITTAPLARLAVTTIGSISGVRPTATEAANNSVSSQFPLVNPLIRKTTGVITRMKRIRSQLTRLMPLSKLVSGRARPLTSFDKGISRVSWLLIRFILVMTPVVFLINGFTKGNWLETLLFAASVAVGLTPEMLPMVVTANLAKGAVVMARRKTIVKRLNAIQNFGAMDVLCTDKTGTLTQNKVILERHLNVHGKEDLQVLQYAWLNSFNQTGLKNLLDVAVLDYAMQH